ncbi:MAG: YbhB/YbcL family Raf kinase inhibitor-like protein [Acidimicrobiia bacterium]
MNVRGALIAVVAAALGLSACGGASVDRPVHTAEDMTEGDGMELTSDAFGHEMRIPTKYTCDGDDLSPPLTISGIPTGTVTLALVVDDPDAPAGTWDHWVAYDVPVVGLIPEGVESLGTSGSNSWGRSGYGGPCPPSGSHRYFFTVYALDARMDLEPGVEKSTLLDAIEGHVLAQATLMGRYSR